MKKKKNPATIKRPLTYAIDPIYEEKIRDFINEISRSTGMTKRRVVSNLIIESIERRNFCAQ